MSASVPVERESNSENTLYSFHRTNTYLHSFGVEIGDKLLNILYHRITICLLLLYGLCCLMLSWTNSMRHFAGFYVTWCVFGLFLWLWVIFCILSVNRKAFNVMTNKFDFWMKIIFSIIFIISYKCWTISTDQYIKNDLNSMTKYILHSILIGIDFILIIIYYSLINGMHIGYKTKMNVGYALSIGSTIFSLQFMLINSNNHKNVYSEIYPQYMSISWYSVSLSSIQILTLFLWKTIYILQKYKKKTTIINTVPSIKWIEDKSKMNESNKNDINNVSDGGQPAHSDRNHENDIYLDVDSIQLQIKNPLPLLQQMTDDTKRESYKSETMSTPTPTSSGKHIKNKVYPPNNGPTLHVPNSAFSPSTSF